MIIEQMNVVALCVEHKIDVKKLTELGGIEETRAVAIVLGRGVPSPDERDKFAGGVPVDARPDRVGTWLRLIPPLAA